MTPVSIIIPTLNEGRAIGPTLDAVARLRGTAEVLVIDGGSGDDTAALAAGRGARVLHAERGRGAQLRAGAAAARHDVLWFLHADTHPPADALERLAAALDDPRVVAGNFALRFDGPGFPARFLTSVYPYLRWLGLCYGDSGIFVRRPPYDAAGGFRPLPLFEDLDLLRRVKKLGRFVRLPAVLVTSSRRFEGRSFTKTFAHWTALQVLYWLGVPPATLARRYAVVRESPAPAPDTAS